MKSNYVDTRAAVLCQYVHFTGFAIQTCRPIRHILVDVSTKRHVFDIETGRRRQCAHANGHRVAGEPSDIAPHKGSSIHEFF